MSELIPCKITIEADTVTSNIMIVCSVCEMGACVTKQAYDDAGSEVAVEQIGHGVRGLLLTPLCKRERVLDEVAAAANEERLGRYIERKDGK